MTRSDIRLLIIKLKNMSWSTQKKLDKSLEQRKFFLRIVEEEKEGEEYKIGPDTTVGELLFEQKKLIESYEKEIRENNNLIKKLEKELEEVRI